MDRKKAQLGKMSTRAIENILETLRPPENKPASAEYPLGGRVHITGIGHVSVEELRDELKSRSPWTCSA